jgi:hypothetical protein
MQEVGGMTMLRTPPRKDVGPGQALDRNVPPRPTLHDHPGDLDAIRRAHRWTVTFAVGAVAVFVGFYILAVIQQRAGIEGDDPGYAPYGYAGLVLIVAEIVCLVGLPMSIARSHRLKAGATSTEATLTGGSVEIEDHLQPRFRWAAAIILGGFCWLFGFVFFMAGLEGDPAGRAPLSVVALILLATGALIAWRVVRLGVRATADGLVIQSLGGTSRIGWSDVARLGARVDRTYTRYGRQLQLSAVIWPTAGAPITVGRFDLFPGLTGWADTLSFASNTMLAAQGPSIAAANAAVFERWMGEHGIALAPSWQALTALICGSGDLATVEERGNRELGVEPKRPPMLTQGIVTVGLGVLLLWWTWASHQGAGRAVLALIMLLAGGITIYRSRSGRWLTR